MDEVGGGEVVVLAGNAEDDEVEVEGERMSALAVRCACARYV